MRYYSDLTKLFYKTEKECDEAEKAYKEAELKKELEEKKKSNARKEAAKKVEDAYNTFVTAKKEYQNQLSDFCQKYGSYHMTLDKDNLFDWMDFFVDSIF